MNNWIYAIAVLLAVACAPNSKEEIVVGKTTATENQSEPIISEVRDDEPRRTMYRETEAIHTDLIHTKLEVSFDWNTSRLKGLEILTAKPHFYPSDSLILDAKGMDILKVKMEGKELVYTYDSSFLKIKLGKTYTRNEKYTLTISYVAKPNERTTSGSAAISSDKGLYFINPKGEDKTKMPQIWTQGETEASSVWFPTIDAPNVKTTQEILMTVEDKYVTLSNGKLISSKKNADGTRTDHWKQDLPHAPYLFMMAVGEFKVVKDSYTRLDGSKMEVNYYVEPEWEPYAKSIFGETPAMIKHFSELLGIEYPWDKYHQIVAREYVSGAMENTGAVVFGDFVYKNNRELLDGNDQSTIAHELFHHWFGDLVTCESWSNLPLNESFANYSQYLWDEFRFGLDEADYQADVEAEGYYQSAQGEGYHDLIWFAFEEKEQMFDAHSYNKGGRILHMLRNYLGDEAFFKGINVYLTTNKFKPVEIHQLRLAFEEVSGKDLNWFFNQWFLAAGHPVLDVAQKVDALAGKVKLTIKQNQNLEVSPLYRLPVDVAVFDSEGKHTHKVMIDKFVNEFEFPFTGELKCVIFDDQQMLLAKVREEKPVDQYIYQYYNGKRYKARRSGISMATKSKDLSVQQLILDALKDPFWHIRLIAIEKAAKLSQENKEKGLKLIRDLAKDDPNSQVRSVALSYLASNGESEMVKEICMDRIVKDQSYLVVSSALKQLSKIDVELAMQKAEGLESERSSKILLGVAQLYGSYAKKEKLAFFEQVLKSHILQGFDQLGVMNSFTYFVARLVPDDIDKAYDLYFYLSEKGDFYTQMFLPQNVDYLLNMFDQKLTELNTRIVEDENNKNAADADQARKEQKVYEALKTKFAVLSKPEEE
jgi:aminopeptidase N